MKHKPSKYQEAIFDEVENGSGNIVVQAVAGSGKTTTLEELHNRIPKGKSIIYVAFNSSIKNELRGRLPRHVEVKTCHAVGLSLFLPNTNNRPEIDADGVKLEKIVHQRLVEQGYEKNSIPYKEKKIFLKKLVPLLKAFYVDYTNFGEIQDVMLKKDFTEELADDVLILVKNIMDDCKNDVNLIDFDDMIWSAVINNFKGPTYDFVIVDESQDLNKVQFELIKGLCNDKTRVIAVGDSRQSIYAFRGADTDSMDNFINYFKAKELPLSICYRCPKKHIRLAQEMVPEIECSPTADEGILEDVKFDELIKKAQTDNLVLSRTNAPLIQVAFALIRSGKKAVIKGRNIGKGLITLIDRYKVVNLEDLVNRIYNYKSLQEDKIALIEKGEYDRRKKNSLLKTIDSCETILVLADNVSTIQELKNQINSIFTDKVEGVICSSIHKAKGLEGDVVFIVNYADMPHPMAKTEEEFNQEINIKYVAVTRSKRELYLLHQLPKEVI